MEPFAQKAGELLALVGEIELEGELVDATSRLRDVAIEADDVQRRFDEAAAAVKRLLVQRIGPRLRAVPEPFPPLRVLEGEHWPHHEAGE